MANNSHKNNLSEGLTDIAEYKIFPENIITKINAAIFLYDIKSARYIWTNNGYYNIIGYTEEEILTLMPDFNEKFFHPHDKYIMQKKIDLYNKNDVDSWSGIYRLKHKQGHWVWVYSITTIFKYDKNYNPGWITGIVIDIPLKLNTEKQLDKLYKESVKLRNKTKIDKLTKREKEILILIAKGESYSAIANKLYISTNTVNSHRKNMLKKLNLKNIATLACFAVKNGLV